MHKLKAKRVNFDAAIGADVDGVSSTTDVAGQRRNVTDREVLGYEQATDVATGTDVTDAKLGGNINERHDLALDRIDIADRVGVDRYVGAIAAADISAGSDVPDVTGHVSAEVQDVAAGRDRRDVAAGLQADVSINGADAVDASDAVDDKRVAFADENSIAAGAGAGSEGVSLTGAVSST